MISRIFGKQNFPPLKRVSVDLNKSDKEKLTLKIFLLNGRNVKTYIYIQSWFCWFFLTLKKV